VPSLHQRRRGYGWTAGVDRRRRIWILGSRSTFARAGRTWTFRRRLQLATCSATNSPTYVACWCLSCVCVLQQTSCVVVFCVMQHLRGFWKCTTCTLGTSPPSHVLPCVYLSHTYTHSHSHSRSRSHSFSLPLSLPLLSGQRWRCGCSQRRQDRDQVRVVRGSSCVVYSSSQNTVLE
jgi:hypothetical protein